MTSASHCILFCLVAIRLPVALRAADQDDSAWFQSTIRPILEEHCVDCHGPDKQKGKLRLDSTEGILRGGESGEPLFVSGLSSESQLITRVTSKNLKEVMPPKGEPLTREQVAQLGKWIDGGARMPGEESARAALRLKTDHWSFQPVKRPATAEPGGKSTN